MRRPVGIAVIGVVVFLLACETTSFEEDPACAGPFVQAQVQSRERLATPCDTNDDLAGIDSLALVDIYFGRSSEADTANQATDAQLELVRANGGEIQHVFDVRAVRALIPLDGLRTVVNTAHWATAYRVTDPDRHLLLVGVGVEGDLTDAHVELFQDVGGAVTDRLDEVDILFGWIDDSSIACLRTKSSIRYVDDAMGVGCLDGNAAETR